MFVQMDLSQRATQKMCVRGNYVAIPNPLDLVRNYEFLWEYLLDLKDLLFDDALEFLCGNASIGL
jgi:hypothetical protein